MKIKNYLYFALLSMSFCTFISAANQTEELSEIIVDNSLPFRVRLKQADFQLPQGVQSYAHAGYGNKWLIVGGRVNGMHGFADDTENFPTKLQNRQVFVIDPINKKTFVRSLYDPGSGLTQEQIDLLSVTAPQAYQSGKTLYMSGGYGVDSATGQLNTKNALTAIDIAGLIHWVTHPHPNETAAQYIRHTYDNIFKVTGGYMNQIDEGPTLLVMGHEFNGFYMDTTQPAFQQYTNQVRRFYIHDDGVNLSFTPEAALPIIPDPSYRRRDLNVVPIVRKVNKKLEKSLLVLSGVFTETTGIWTVPVEVSANGEASMADPTLPSTFKQGMNNYDCATFGMFSKKTGDMYTILLGGISFGFFEQTATGLQFKTDAEFPFINQATVVRTDKEGGHSQYFLPSANYPYIASKTVHKGNPMLFGAEGEVFLLHEIHKYSNHVLELDKIKKSTLIGYVIGGIQSSVPNTTTQADSFASPYLFEIIVEPVHDHCHCPCH